MKTVTIIPMIHTLEELGSLGESVRKAHEQTRGILGARKFSKDIERYWEEVARRIRAAGFYSQETARGLHIFVDGLPNTDDEIVRIIVAELVGQKLPVYIIIDRLQRVGANICGTEDPKLLLEEHSIWTKLTQGGIKPDACRLRQLLEERDSAIARRIDEILPGRGRGLLFIGKAHDVAGELAKLPNKFRVVYL